MKKLTLYILFLFLTLYSIGQTTPNIALQLQPYRLKGGWFLKKNLSFEEYKTSRFQRTFGSYFANRPLFGGTLLAIEGVPIYHRNQRHSKDVFHFELYHQGVLKTITNVRAMMSQNESFFLFRSRQDSSFFGNRNSDFLEARIEFPNAPVQTWEVWASNLNGSKPEAQKGMIRKDTTTIHFIRTMTVLRDKPVDQMNPESLFTSLYATYAFTYQNEIIATVTVDEGKKDRKLWLKQGLSSEIKDVIASTVVILTKRRDIYK
jgi:hypothetical protein